MKRLILCGTLLCAAILSGDRTADAVWFNPVKRDRLWRRDGDRRLRRRIWLWGRVRWRDRGGKLPAGNVTGHSLRRPVQRADDAGLHQLRRRTGRRTSTTAKSGPRPTSQCAKRTRPTAEKIERNRHSAEALRAAGRCKPQAAQQRVDRSDHGQDHLAGSMQGSQFAASQEIERLFEVRHAQLVIHAGIGAHVDAIGCEPAAGPESGNTARRSRCGRRPAITTSRT